MNDNSQNRHILALWCLGLLIALSVLGMIVGGTMVATNNAAVEIAARDGWINTNAAALATLGGWILSGGAILGVVLLFFGAFYRSPLPR